MEKIIDNIIQSVSEIVKYDSSLAPAEENAPFGLGARQSLDYFLKLAASFGFETRDYDGYAGEVVFGDGEEFAILAHLDVVPAGGGWTHEPFGGEIDEENKKIWGRGTMDDKGPAIIALYAMHALKEQGFTPSKKIKLIVGCNEEAGWKCIKYYNAHAHMPDIGFSPDADFPAIYAEKGIMHVRFNFKADGDFSSLKGGERPNMVCDYCETGLKGAKGKYKSRGRSAHGSTPELGVNAMPPVLRYLGLDDICNLLFREKFSLTGLKDETGALTFSPNVISGAENSVFVTCDIRYPATYTREQILEIIDRHGIDYEILSEQAPLYNDPDSFLLTTLCSVYNEVTGKDLKPIAIGGGTYARALKFGAAFGPEEAGEESTIHQANEYITFEKIERCFEIYRLAIERLTK